VAKLNALVGSGTDSDDTESNDDADPLASGAAAASSLLGNGNSQQWRDSVAAAAAAAAAAAQPKKRKRRPAAGHRAGILLLDSARYHDTQAVFRVVRRYLEFAWNMSGHADTYGKRKFKESVSSSAPSVAMQSNGADCALFMLHFYETLAREPPAGTDFRALTSMVKKRLGTADVTGKRREIAKLLHTLAEKQRAGGEEWVQWNEPSRGHDL